MKDNESKELMAVVLDKKKTVQLSFQTNESKKQNKQKTAKAWIRAYLKQADRK